MLFKVENRPLTGGFLRLFIIRFARASPVVGDGVLDVPPQSVARASPVVGDGVLDVPSRCSRAMREAQFTTATPSNHSFPSRCAPEASPTGEVSRLVVTEGAHKTNLASRGCDSLLAPTGASHHLPRRGGYRKRRRECVFECNPNDAVRRRRRTLPLTRNQKPISIGCASVSRCRGRRRRPAPIGRASVSRPRSEPFLSCLFARKELWQKKVGDRRGKTILQGRAGGFGVFSACEAAVFLNKNGGRRFVNSAILGARGLFRLQTRVPFGIIFTRGRANRP